jgi:hypothetical protein
MRKYFWSFFILILTIAAPVFTVNISAAQDNAESASAFEQAREILFEDQEKALSLLEASKGAPGVIPVE